ncbi:MAG TPA: penicillin-binding transpeptidase domain-containing protein [Micromonosporaceae bacterium]|nr:penicillin-binding transpeptidase domain-containing protein [Micromonosporaceae bacterium]
MNAPLRRVGVVVLVLFALLFINLNWVQGYKANDYRTSRYNGRVLLTDYERQRGTIYDANGNALASSVATNGALKYLRTYPGGPAYEPILGYKPVNLASTGIEDAMDVYLAGNAASDQRITDLFSDRRSPGDNVFLTLDKNVQTTAYDALVNNGSPGDVGAIVAMDPNTGKILAMASTPSFNATDLASHTNSTATATYKKLSTDADQPLLNRAISTTAPPGSTFKLIVTAAALSSGRYNTNTVIPAGSSYQPVKGSSYVMHNAESETCPQSQITLIQALTVSCNTAFGQLGVALGGQAITDQAKAFGFDDSFPLAGSGDRTLRVAASEIGDVTNGSGADDPNLVAQSSIGQFDDRMTPLMGAMIASAVATGGTEMKPYIVDHIQSPDLRVTQIGQPQVYSHPVTPQVAAEMQQMMFSVVQNGTAQSAQISGLEVGGKTGTAQNGFDANGQPLLDHRWFLGFAMKDGKPIAAVCVFLKNAGDKARQSAPAIGGDVLRAAVDALGGK